jgi:hypothetical protein
MWLAAELGETEQALTRTLAKEDAVRKDLAALKAAAKTLPKGAVRKTVEGQLKDCERELLGLRKESAGLKEDAAGYRRRMAKEDGRQRTLQGNIARLQGKTIERPAETARAWAESAAQTAVPAGGETSTPERTPAPETHEAAKPLAEYLASWNEKSHLQVSVEDDELVEKIGAIEAINRIRSHLQNRLGRGAYPTIEREIKRLKDHL